MADSHMEETERYIAEHGMSGINTFFRRKLKEWKRQGINIGVIGDAESGKSSFVNTIRGHNNNGRTAGAARTGFVETRLPRGYPFPENNRIILWDLPGIGTPNYPADTYRENVDLNRYDTFLFLSANGFSENDLRLARIVQSLNKSFFFVRTKIDIDFWNERTRRTFNEGALLRRIKENCSENLEELEANVFLISDDIPYKWDFARLTQAILDVLPMPQKRSLTLSLDLLANRSLELLRRKVGILRDRILTVAAASCTGRRLISIPGLSIELDIWVLKNEIEMYKRQFGLHDENSHEFRKMTPENQEKIKKCCVTGAVQVGRLISAYTARFAAQQFIPPNTDHFPEIRESFSSSYQFLYGCLNDIEEIALEAMRNYRETMNDTPRLEDVSECIENHGVSGLAEFFKSKLPQWKNLELKIGVTGCGNTGKSSFVNAITRLATSTEIEARPYPHPTHENIVFWDLPGIGSAPNYPDLETYCKEVELEKYDAFLICSDRLTYFDLQLARKLRSYEKSFFFLRTKIDQVVNEQRFRQINVDMETTLNDIRRRIVEDLDVDAESVFLISNHETTNEEFARLKLAILDVLLQWKRASLQSTFKSFSEKSKELLKEKAKELRDRIQIVAGTSGAGALVPVFGVSLALDACLLWREVNSYRSQLGLPDENSDAFQGLSPQSRERVQAFLVASTTEIGKLFSIYGTSSAVEEVARYVPLVGSVISGGISFVSTYYFLKYVLDGMENTALDILDILNEKFTWDLRN